MPPASDWRSASTAEKLIKLDRPQFAAEFLRRNHDYNKDFRITQDLIASGAVAYDAAMERLASRWGLSFPACTRHRCMGIACHLASGTVTFRCYCRSRA